MDCRVVVVDDDALCLKQARGLLNAQGMKATCLRSGQALLGYMESHDADLILLDIQMPGMDGFAALRASLRECDIVFKNRHDQFVAVLPVLADEDDADVGARVLKAWRDAPPVANVEIAYATEVVSFADGRGMGVE